MNKFLLTIFTVLSSNVFADGDFRALEGDYAVTGAYTSDIGSSHLRIVLNGEPAKDLYLAMDTEVFIDECTETESKTVGKMQCFFYKENKSYECNFAINLDKQTIEHGIPC
ncbi:hypothetical protein [Motilimonas pumila]|uniref:Uncharacterized protein n=1 Tax=Motilimonas pumila TaxID=2303987 RepID=A0A418YG84_9GAMM|nr:hypothetical protein [Motilimonas pumila]RJG48499.1 hypothetical protein D1Z90_08385 [Motilimonas pumila]